MAIGYMYDEALSFYIEYFALYPHTWHQETWMKRKQTIVKSLKGRLNSRGWVPLNWKGFMITSSQTLWQLKGYIGLCFTLTNCFQCYGPIPNSCVVHA
jgi:hypothetical protein